MCSHEFTKYLRLEPTTDPRSSSVDKRVQYVPFGPEASSFKDGNRPEVDKRTSMEKQTIMATKQPIPPCAHVSKKSEVPVRQSAAHIGKSTRHQAHRVLRPRTGRRVITPECQFERSAGGVAEDQVQVN